MSLNSEAKHDDTENKNSPSNHDSVASIDEMILEGFKTIFDPKNEKTGDNVILPLTSKCGKKSYKMTLYSPEKFSAYRKEQNIEEEQFIKSMQNFKPFKNTGKSGSTFLLTSDNKYLLKTMNTNERERLFDMMKEVGGLLKKGKKEDPSFLCKFFGAFKIKQTYSNLMPHIIPNTKIMCIMNNLFLGIETNYVYDLKGSTYKRETDEEKKKTASTLKDTDFYNDVKNLEVSESAFKKISETLEKDTKFLEKHKITDYSFLLGILDVDDLVKKLENNNKNLAMQTSTHADEKENQSETSTVILKTVAGAENDITLPPGGICARYKDKENNNYKEVIVYAQIIDFLIYFDSLKKIEQMSKKKLQPNASVQRPAKYAARFKNFLVGSGNTEKNGDAKGVNIGHVFKSVELKEGESDWLSEKPKIETSIANTKFGDFCPNSNAE